MSILSGNDANVMKLKGDGTGEVLKQKGLIITCMTAIYCIKMYF